MMTLPRHIFLPWPRVWQRLAIATNWPILVAVGLLSAIGLLTIWAGAPGSGQRQAVFLGIAFLCMAAFQAVDYRKIGYYAFGFYGVALALIAYTVLGSLIGGVPGVTNRKGAYNWIAFGSFTLQPAELMKIGFVMVLARYLRYRSNYRTLVGLLQPFALAGVPIVFILKQPDLGTAIIFVPTLFIMLFVAGAKLKHLCGITSIVIALMPLIWLSGMPSVPLFKHLPAIVKPYQRDRVYAMFNNDAMTMEGTGFQQEQGQMAMGSGGWTGKGLGNIPVGTFVPEKHNDMVFTLVGEQFGFFGSAVVLFAYVVIFAVGIEIAGSTREPFGRLIAVGVVSMLSAQTFINLMVAMKVMPVTGITLPFISYGGSSLIASFMAIGLLLNVGQNRPMVMAKDSFEFEN